MHPPRYVPDAAALAGLGDEARRWRCPHCGRSGTLNAHGRLRGGAENLPGKDAVRGRRFFCSNRGRRPGCGRTCSVLLAQMLRGASVRTGSLWRFCRARLGGLGLLAAWEQARNLTLATLIEAVRAQKKQAGLDLVNKALLQPHWRSLDELL